MDQRWACPLTGTGLFLGLRPASERRWYKLTSSLIGWAQTSAMHVYASLRNDELNVSYLSHGKILVAYDKVNRCFAVTNKAYSSNNLMWSIQISTVMATEMCYLTQIGLKENMILEFAKFYYTLYWLSLLPPISIEHIFVKGLLNLFYCNLKT